jgi:glycosyltransferase involved in cell wall biosynthesis
MTQAPPAPDPSTSRPTLICFAGDTWDGNPHSRHHLALRFAERFDVLFVEGVPMRSVTSGDPHEWRRVLEKLKARAQLRTVRQGLHVLRPLPIPPAGRLGRRAQLANLRREVLRACVRLRLSEPRIAWFSLPGAAPLRGTLGEKASVFYYQDRYDQFSYVDGERLRRQVDELARGCDLVIASAEPLAEDLRRSGAEALVVGHGVDIERFAGSPLLPHDLVGLERPIVGYVGLLDDYLYIEAIIDVADRLDHGTVVLVGAANIDVRALRHPRIVLLGRRPYDAIPGYLAAFDTCLVPFRDNELTRGVNPIKLREYLAAGRPVVSSPLPEVLPYADVVELADRGEEFFPAVQRTLAPGYDTPARREARRRRVAGESWDSRAQAIERLMWALLDGETGETRLRRSGTPTTHRGGSTGADLASLSRDR